MDRCSSALRIRDAAIKALLKVLRGEKCGLGEANLLRQDDPKSLEPHFYEEICKSTRAHVWRMETDCESHELLDGSF